MRSILIGLLTLGSISSFAQNDLKAIKRQNPEASNREVLKLLYNSSLVAADPNYDFDMSDDRWSNQECRMTNHSTGDNLNSVVIRKIIKMIPPDCAPFPSISEMKLNLTGSHNLINGRAQSSFYKGFDFISMEENAYDLIVYQKKNPHHTDSPYKLFLRKNGNLISFKVLTYKGGQDNGPLFENNVNVNEDYGYCWRK